MSNPDNRADNARKIRKSVENTQHNIEMAEEIIAETPNEQTKGDLEAKNERRKQAIPGMKHELGEEIQHQREIHH